MCLNIFLGITSLTLKTIQKGVDTTVGFVQGIPAECFLAGCASGLAGRVATLPVLPPPPTCSRVSTLYRFTPLWGMRICFYTAMTDRMIKGREDNHPLLQAPVFAASGAFAEGLTRFLSNPINRVRYTRDIRAVQGEKVSFVGQVAHIWQRRGIVGYFEGSPSFRVEMLWMGVFFGIFNTLRNTVLEAAGLKEAHHWAHVPLNGACAALSAAAAVTATYSFREQAFDDQTRRTKSFYVLRTKPQLMQGQPLLCGLCFALYTVLAQGLCAVTGAKVPHTGFGGWEPPEEEEVSRFGGNMKPKGIGVMGGLSAALGLPE